MPRPVIPRFRAIRGGWRKSAVAQAATLVLKRGMLGDVIHIRPHDPSPHDKARDQETEEAVLASFPATWRAVIRSVGCGATECRIELRAPCTVEAARGITEALAQAFEGCDVVINGLSLRWEGEDLWRYPGYPWTTSQERIDYVAKLIGHQDG
jgi:hypothetical protein